jgi:hypothetical protein
MSFARKDNATADRLVASAVDEATEFWRDLKEEDDLRPTYALVQERIRYYRQAGRPIPEKLRRCERHMMAEFMARSQGR